MQQFGMPASHWRGLDITRSQTDAGRKRGQRNAE